MSGSRHSFGAWAVLFALASGQNHVATGERRSINMCNAVSVTTGSELTSVRVAQGSCSNDPSVVCAQDTDCRFCLENRRIPCTSAGNCTPVGGECGGPGTCTKLDRPTVVTAPNTERHRLFLAEQPGRIRIVKDGVLLTTPFLDIVTLVDSSAFEEGLLGLAFSPKYERDGLFFVFYRAHGGVNKLVRYSVSANPDRAVPASAVEVLSIVHESENHHGGCLQFGPIDGALYVSTGDNSFSCDPGAMAQNPQSLNGKLLRLEVIPAPVAPPPAPQYGVPWYNPFVGPGGPLDEIVSMGLRNPWRFSLDRENGDLYLGDVGQYRYEEIDYKSYRNLGGENFGWPRHEGMACPVPICSPTCSPVTSRIDPIKSYGRSVGCAVTGGYVYRGCRMPDLRGRYFYGDFCPMIQSFVVSGGIVSEEKVHTTELRPVDGTQIDRITSFGEDAQGEIYFTDYSGQVLKIVPLLRNLEVSGIGATMLHLDQVWTWENLSRATSHPVDEYRIYRADGRGDGLFTCIHSSGTNRWPGGDPLVPHPGGLFSYLVTAVRRFPTFEESSPGASSDGVPRALSPAACPH